MLKKYYPYEYVESAFDIDYKKLYDKGFRGIVFDIDNTLVHHGDDSNSKVDGLIEYIQSLGFKTLFMSNNDAERVERFLKNISSMYICDAAKPDTECYVKALNMLELKKNEVVFVGDQVFTDILGANKCGAVSVLVKYIHLDGDRKIGIKRRIESIILALYKRNIKYRQRLGGISEKGSKQNMAKGKLFCEINPTCYAISMKKENFKRHIKNLFDKSKIAKSKSETALDNVVFHHSSNMIKRAPGVNLTHQENKVVNIRLAGGKINGLIIHPGETFSFWQTVGKITKKKGYMEGRIIENNRLIAGIGGGLCNLANTLNLLILHSPLEICEFHKHSDALAPDEGKRVPFSAGTSVCYNHIDYRFKNTQDCDVQLLVWCDGEVLHAELRSEKEFPYTYELAEEDHHFKKHGDKFYRNSMIYRLVTDKKTGEQVAKELIHKNHSEVMFDYSLIPDELIRE